MAKKPTKAEQAAAAAATPKPRTIKQETKINWFDGTAWNISPPIKRPFTTRGLITKQNEFEFIATIEGRARTCRVPVSEIYEADHEPKAYLRTFVNPTETGWQVNTMQERFYCSLFGPMYELQGYLNASAPYRFSVSFFHLEGDAIDQYITQAKKESRARMEIAITSINELLNLNPE